MEKIYKGVPIIKEQIKTKNIRYVQFYLEKVGEKVSTHSKEIKKVNGSYFIRITDLKSKYEFKEGDWIFFDVDSIEKKGVSKIGKKKERRWKE